MRRQATTSMRTHLAAWVTLLLFAAVASLLFFDRKQPDAILAPTGQAAARNI